jgi:hypothetical protein
MFLRNVGIHPQDYKAQQPISESELTLRMEAACSSEVGKSIDPKDYTVQQPKNHTLNPHRRENVKPYKKRNHYVGRL